MRILQILMLFAAVNLYSQTPVPDWYLLLREVVYEQELKSDEIVPLYNSIKTHAEKSLSGAPLYVMLSRCEYMMGRVYLFEANKPLADKCFDTGMKLAEKAIQTAETDTAWQMLAENLSQVCSIRPWSYVLANGLNVAKFSENALAINKRNAAAQYLVAARWIYAPPPFHNYKKGLDMMLAIIKEGDMQKDDEFNIYSSIGYAYYLQKNYVQAKIWMQKSLEIYPTNKYVLGLINNLPGV